MQHVQARAYPTAEFADAAFAGIVRIVDRRDAHAVALRVTLNEPERVPLVVLIFDDPELATTITTGHWHGGMPHALLPAYTEAFLESARRREAEADGEEVREHVQHEPGSHLTPDGRIVPPGDES